MLAEMLARLDIKESDGPALTTLFGEPRPRHLLAVAGLGESMRSQVEECGCLTGSVPCVGGAVMVLQRRGFDGIIVRPDAENGLGLKLLCALKLDATFPGLSERYLEPLRRQVEATPFWIAPLPGEDEYGLVLANGYVALRRQAELPMCEAICRLKAFERTPKVEA